LPTRKSRGGGVLIAVAVPEGASGGTLPEIRATCHAGTAFTDIIHAAFPSPCNGCNAIFESW
jgi:hypothetical protein